MRVHLSLLLCLFSSANLAQTEDGSVVPKVVTLPIEARTVTVLHLAAGYTTSVKLPEEISSVVIGNPASFKAEHSEAEPRLVFLKPITARQSETNALITTKSGQEINLYLVSAAKVGPNTRVDFLVEYRRPRALVINSDFQSFLVPETRSVSSANSGEALRPVAEEQDAVAKALVEQGNSSPAWRGIELCAAVGKSAQLRNQIILGFSVLNNAKRVIELLPPQLELSGSKKGSGNNRITLEPVAVSEYRMTTRRLVPGQRSDGVIVFARPSFKASTERLQLHLAEAEQVDHPILLAVPFSSDIQEGVQ